MKLIFLPQQLDPFFNLALEEYLFKCSKDEFLFLYRNTAAFVIGKHQIAAAEAYLPFLQESGIPLIRRLSGGGAVFHDSGNLNFCFISNVEGAEKISFRYFIEKISDTLNDLGIPTIINSRNSLELEGAKISGNAEHIVRNRVLHHGTLLYDTRLEILNACINPNRNDFEDKSVRSLVSPVRNIGSFRSFGSIEDFTMALLGYLKTRLPIFENRMLSQEDYSAVENLIKTKYATSEWNFDYSPAYGLTRLINDGQLNAFISICVENGHVVSSIGDFCHSIVGLRHDYETFLNQLGHDENIKTFLKYFF